MSSNILVKPQRLPVLKRELSASGNTTSFLGHLAFVLSKLSVNVTYTNTEERKS